MNKTRHSSLTQRPQQFLNFFPDPQGQGSFRPVFGTPERTGIGCVLADDPESCTAYGCGKSLAWINQMQEGPINIARKRAMRSNF